MTCPKAPWDNGSGVHCWHHDRNTRTCCWCGSAVTEKPPESHGPHVPRRMRKKVKGP